MVKKLLNKSHKTKTNQDKNSPLVSSEADNSVVPNSTQKHRTILLILLLIVFSLFITYTLNIEAAGSFKNAMNVWVNVFFAFLLQSLPFLLLGSILASCVQVFVSDNWLEKHRPKSLGIGMLYALFFGFCLPICDCASIPLFKTLIKKKFPLPLALTFVSGTAVINPVVVLSTYYSFGGDMLVVTARITIGIICALLIGLCFVHYKKPESIIKSESDASCHSCTHEKKVLSFSQKIVAVLEQAQHEFLHIGKYLVLGSFVSSVLHTFGMQFLRDRVQGLPSILLILFMMLIAFILSLCSSSDAVIMSGFAALIPLPGLIAFLVFGPMMNIKIIAMLSAHFSKKFIFYFALTTACICFSVISLLTVIGVLS